VRRLFALALGLTIGLPLVAVMLVFVAASSQAHCGQGVAVGPGDAPGVPSELLVIYDRAAGEYGLGPGGWAYLAAINYIETNFGRDLSVSTAGAIGWMQFEPGTWAQYAVSADPSKPGAPPDPYDPWDAIFAAASYLRASGAPADWEAAIFAYNHAGWYVSGVQQLAQQFAQTTGAGQVTGVLVSVAAGSGGACPVAAPLTPGSVARIGADGIAQAPADAPVQVQEAIAAGDRIIDSSYSQERDPGMLTTVMASYDCSGSTDFVLYNTGLGGPQVDVGDGIAGDSRMLESYGEPGPGRWITVFASAGHAFVEVAGLVLDTAWYASVQPTSPGSGPRWQPASIITAQLQDGNTWTERHPPGF